MSRNRKNKNSTFFSSFWRETGRNTGKWASNKIFGNTGWATPRRHIIEGDSTSTKPKRVGAGILGNQNTSIEMSELRDDVNSKITELSKKKFPRDSKNLVELLFELEVLLHANIWRGVGINGDERHKITNQYADALFMKYKQGVEMLRAAASKTISINRFTTKVSHFQRKKVLGKYGFGLKYALLLVIIFTLLFIFYE
jgi:hypothetical protein